MTNKNPYTKDTGDLDIPDFVEEKTRSDSNSIDMSIFKMSDDELYDDTSDQTKVYGEEDYDSESAPKRKKKGNGSLILCLVIIFLLMALLAGAGFYALKQHQAYVKANTAYLQMQANEANYKKQIADQATTIETLSKQIEELKNSAKGEGNIVYEIIDGPISFRTGPSRDSDDTTYNGNDVASNSEKYKVIEIVADEDPDEDLKWAKVADKVYFCIGTSEEVWAKKAD